MLLDIKVFWLVPPICIIVFRRLRVAVEEQLARSVRWLSIGMKPPTPQRIRVPSPDVQSTLWDSLPYPGGLVLLRFVEPRSPRPLGGPLARASFPTKPCTSTASQGMETYARCSYIPLDPLLSVSRSLHCDSSAPSRPWSAVATEPRTST